MFHPPALTTTLGYGRCLKCLIQRNECNFQEALRVDFLLWRSLSPLGKYLNLRSALSASWWRKAMFWVLGLGGSVHLWVQSRERERECVCVCVCVCVCWHWSVDINKLQLQSVCVCVCACVCVCVHVPAPVCVDIDNWTFISSSSRENSRSPSKQLSSSSQEQLKYALETLFCIHATKQPRFFEDTRFFIQ